jgi:hypothetical protein
MGISRRFARDRRRKFGFFARADFTLFDSNASERTIGVSGDNIWFPTLRLSQESAPISPLARAGADGSRWTSTKVSISSMEVRTGGVQEVIMDDREIVAAIRAQLAERVGKDRYEVWFGHGTQFTRRGETLVVQVRDQFFQDWLRLHFRKDLEIICEQVCGAPLSLEFHIAPIAPPAEDARISSAPQADHHGRPSQSSVLRTAQSPRGDATDPVLARRRFASLESFIVGNSNFVAHKTPQITTEQPGTY